MEVVRSFPSLWFDRALMRNLVVSFGRVLLGFLASRWRSSSRSASSWAAFSKVKAMFSPLSVFGAYLPIPTLVPLTMSLFGTGETQKIVFLALAFGIYLLPLIVAAVDAVDDIYLKTAYTLGARQPAGGQQGAAGDRLAGHLPGPAHGLRGRLELHPAGRDGGHRARASAASS